MKKVTPKKLRTELKTYLDTASKEPVKIERRSGKSYILISEERYMELVGLPVKEKKIKKEKKEKKGKKTKKKLQVKTGKKVTKKKVAKSKS